ncbi:MAG: hypothetical protein WCP21_11115 [Armatimonadota bacterium]
MRTITVVMVLAVVVALMLSLSSCSVKTSTGTETAAPAPADTAAKPEAATPAPTAESAVKVSIVAGDKFDEASKKITNETTSFTVDTPEIFVNAEMSGLTKDAKVTGTISAVDVVLADGTEVKDKDLKSTDVVAPADVITARFSFTPPAKGWPVGSYVVKIAVDGKEVDSVDLTVEKAAG